MLAACARSGADAIHPGYGFLSENEAFAQAVIDAGIKWLGPTPEVIGLMGDKLSAKRLMDEAGVPTLPGIEISADTDITAAAKEIGYPVLVKASAGGGGRGMRVVEQEADLLGAVEGAKGREFVWRRHRILGEMAGCVATRGDPDPRRHPRQFSPLL